MSVFTTIRRPVSLALAVAMRAAVVTPTAIVGWMCQSQHWLLLVGAGASGGMPRLATARGVSPSLCRWGRGHLQAVILAACDGGSWATLHIGGAHNESCTRQGVPLSRVGPPPRVVLGATPWSMGVREGNGGGGGGARGT